MLFCFLKLAKQINFYLTERSYLQIAFSFLVRNRKWFLKKGENCNKWGFSQWGSCSRFLRMFVNVSYLKSEKIYQYLKQRHLWKDLGKHAHVLDRSGQFAQQNDEIPLHMVSLATTSLPRLQSSDSQKFSFLLQTIVNASQYNGSLTHYTKSWLLWIYELSF